MNTNTIDGYYGGSTRGRATAGTIYTYEEGAGTWYAVHGSINVNFTRQPVEDGVWIEELEDSDTSTAGAPIMSEEDLRDHVEDATEPQEEQDPFEDYDESEYDTDAMRTDAANGNFSADRAEEYRHEAIVDASIINGQFRQAREQCQRYGLSYEEALVRNDRDPAAH